MPFRPVILALVAVLLPFMPLPGASALAPAFLRLDLEPTATATASLTLTAPPGTAVTAIATDCACLHATLALPATVGSTGTLAIPLAVSGLRPGIKAVTVRTTAGAATAHVQIAGPGAGDGAAVLAGALASATARGRSLWGIVHDLRGQVRNCGCSQGSLGGIGHLARLPGAVASQAPAVAARWVLTGTVDGDHAGVGAALQAAGWRIGDAAVAVAADPVPALTAAGVVAVIPTRPTAIEHQRLLRPALDRGLAVDLLLVDQAGTIRERHVLPVDGTLPDDPALAARFAAPLTWRIAGDQDPSTDCRACHAAAHDAWTGSRHARAFASLAAADRTDACVTCHGTPVAERILAPGVHCQACHAGGTAHVAAAGAVRTAGVVDCRSCHDAAHHPAFQREGMWDLIRHGR